MPLAPYDGTIPENTNEFNDFVANLGIDTSGGGGSYGHGTYFSPSSGATNWGYVYHLPPTWTSEPNRKFPVVYVPSLGGGSDENEWFRRSQVADPLADSPIYTSNQDGFPWFLNWGKNAKCVTIVLNGGRDIPFPFNANPLADMNGVLMLETQQDEVLDFIESPTHPVFGGRLIPQGKDDPNGGKYRGIMGHSGGTHHSAYHAAKHPERYSSVFLLAVSGGGDWDPNFGDPGFGPWQIHMCASDQNWAHLNAWAISRPDGSFGATFVANQTNIFNAGIWWHMQVSHPEGINETVSTNFWNNLNNNGFNVDAEILIPFSWHTSWCYTGSGGPQPLPWHVSKFQLNPTPNPSSYSTPMDVPLNVQGGTLTANDTDPQLLALSVASVQNAVNGTVSLANNTVTFTPANGYVGPASFDYTESNTDGQTASATVSVNVTSSVGPQLLADDLDISLFVDDIGFTCFIDDVGNFLTCSSASPSTTSLICAPNPAFNGTTVTFTGTVIPISPLPTGQIQFTDGGSNTYATVNLTGNSAQFSTSLLSVGAHPVQALYLGDLNYNPSSSSVVVEQIVSAPVNLLLMGQACL